MKKLLLIALTTLLFSCTAEQEIPTDECDCRTEYYLYVPNVGGGGGQYEFQFSEQTDFDCRQPYGTYYPVSNQFYNYAKVVCD